MHQETQETPELCLHGIQACVIAWEASYQISVFTFIPTDIAAVLHCTLRTPAVRSVRASSNQCNHDLAFILRVPIHAILVRLALGSNIPKLVCLGHTSKNGMRSEMMKKGRMV